MEAALKSLESSGGYAILLGVVILALFYLARGWMSDQAQRSADREAQNKNDFQSQIEHERLAAQSQRDMTERMIKVVEGNTGAITTLVETIRPMSETLVRIDRHMGVEAKSAVPRKPAGAGQ